MKEKVMLLYVGRPDSFTNDKTGELIEGGNIAMCEIESTSDDRGIGRFTKIKWCSIDLCNKLLKTLTPDKLPCEAEAIYEVNTRSKKASLRLIDIEVK